MQILVICSMLLVVVVLLGRIVRGAKAVARDLGERDRPRDAASISAWRTVAADVGLLDRAVPGGLPRLRGSVGGPDHRRCVENAARWPRTVVVASIDAPLPAGLGSPTGPRDTTRRRPGLTTRPEVARSSSGSPAGTRRPGGGRPGLGHRLGTGWTAGAGRPHPARGRRRHRAPRRMGGALGGAGSGGGAHAGAARPRHHAPRRPPRLRRRHRELQRQPTPHPDPPERPIPPSGAANHEGGRRGPPRRPDPGRPDLHRARRSPINASFPCNSGIASGATCCSSRPTPTPLRGWRAAPLRPGSARPRDPHAHRRARRARRAPTPPRRRAWPGAALSPRSRPPAGG